MRLVLAALLIVAAVGSAFAQPLPAPAGAPVAETPVRAPRPTLQQRFDSANVTHDGKLTLDQARAADIKRVVAHFDAIDAKRKGFVTMDDIHAYARAQRAAKNRTIDASHPGPYRD